MKHTLDSVHRKKVQLHILHGNLYVIYFHFTKLYTECCTRTTTRRRRTTITGKNKIFNYKFS